MNSVLDYKTKLINAVEQYNRNYQVLVKLMENFAAFTAYNISYIHLELTMKRYAKGGIVLRQWFRNWLILRDEWSLVYLGAICNESQRVDNCDFIDPRTYPEFVMKNFVLCSAEGIREWQIVNQEVC